MIEADDGAGRLRKRMAYLYEFIGRSKEGRHIRDCQGEMLEKFGITPRTTNKYLEWLVRYGKIQYTTASQQRVVIL